MSWCILTGRHNARVALWPVTAWRCVILVRCILDVWFYQRCRRMYFGDALSIQQIKIIVGAQIQQMLFMHFNGIYFCFGLFPRGSMLPLVIAKMGYDSVCHVFLAPSPTHLNSTQSPIMWKCSKLTWRLTRDWLWAELRWIESVRALRTGLQGLKLWSRVTSVCVGVVLSVKSASALKLIIVPNLVSIRTNGMSTRMGPGVRGRGGPGKNLPHVD